jgi:hypothetical protein
VPRDRDARAPDDGMAEPTATYAVITSTGELRMHTVDNRISLDEWGTPYQDDLWAAVHDDVDPHRGEVNGVALDGDMRAKIADAAEYDLENHPPNPVATAVLTTLGHEPRHWSGTIAIVGHEDDNGITASLTREQRKVITEAYWLAVAAQRQTA